MNLEMQIARLNAAQKAAVRHTEGPLLVIAGAGSGKTSVLVCRIANIINSRLAFPWQVLAVTFTNKAAGELRERLVALLDYDQYNESHDFSTNTVWAGTFHSTCIKILRRGIEELGFQKSFTIYDTDDSLRLIKLCMKELNISEKSYTPKSVFGDISRAKDKLIKPRDFVTTTDDGRTDIVLEVTSKVYSLYQKKMKEANALDFDDIIVKTVELFEGFPAILERWQKQFRYIMVDEYQDTNYAQYRLISLLAGGKNGNLCVVGDEDQSIYRFRGATIENILSFEEEFDATVIKLEQNYRSTKAILGAANGVIKNNTQRKHKTLFTAIDGGDKVKLHIHPNEHDEAVFIAREIEKGKGNGIRFGDNAILYRTNAQSRTPELVLSRMSIPYRMIGGVRFYDRKEVKDIIAYMSVVNNPYDIIRFRRIINEPKRSIGEVTQSEIEKIAEENNISPIDVMAHATRFFPKAKAATLAKLAAVFTGLTAKYALSTSFVPNENGEFVTLSDLIDDVIEQTGYLEMLKLEGEEGLTRLENIKELKSAAVKFQEEYFMQPTNDDETSADTDSDLTGNVLSDFLSQVALVSDTDDYATGEDKAVMMTIHAAKGLEFDRVFLIGAEENIFPSYRCLFDPADIEEERRLAYVAITRAKKSLYVTTAKERMLYGYTQRNEVSRFINEIPDEHIFVDDRKVNKKVAVTKTTAKIDPRKLTLNANTAAAKVPVGERPVFAVGERVKHKVFGVGMVMGVSDMGNDVLLEIAFDTVGTKKVMALHTKISKI